MTCQDADEDEESKLASSEASEVSHLYSPVLYMGRDKKSELSSSDVSHLSSPVFGPARPPPPRFVNVQERLDHAINKHSRPTLRYQTTPPLTTAEILSAGLLCAGFEPIRQQRNNIARKMNGSKHFTGWNLLLSLLSLLISRVNAQILSSKIA